jgi:UrcA family protein
MKKTLILAALVAASLAAPLAAQAKTPQLQQISVSAEGLDLNNPADAAILVQRIEAAARPVCVVPDAAEPTTTRGCIRKLTRLTVKSMKVPTVTLAYEQTAKSGRRTARG